MAMILPRCSDARDLGVLGRYLAASVGSGDENGSGRQGSNDAITLGVPRYGSRQRRVVRVDRVRMGTTRGGFVNGRCAHDEPDPDPCDRGGLGFI